MKKTYCGYITIVGKTNVGKSTLINKLLKKKISITSKRTNTTQQQIIGIKTTKKYQLIYIDTPGFTKKKHLFLANKEINKIKFKNTNLIIFIVDNIYWNNQDQIILNELCKLKKKILLVINKIDKIKDKNNLLPYINFINKKTNFVEIIPISAKKNFNRNLFEKTLYKYIPKSKHIFQKKYITSHSNNFIIIEIIREKLIRFCGTELTHKIDITVEQLTKKKNNLKIYILILVQKTNEKKIIIGKNGNKIKKINFFSTKSIENFFSKKIFLKIWIKLKKK